MTDNKLEKYRLTDQLREKIAKHIFYELHPITDMFPDYWGITGTMDDESWRRLEKHCFYSADQVLSKLLSLLEEAKREEQELLKKAVELIKVWHNGEAVMKLGEEQAEYMWNIYYNHSPEMKDIRQALTGEQGSSK